MTTKCSGLAEQTAFSEMLEETGLTPSDLQGDMEYVGGYPFDESRPKDNFYNSEWRDVYIGRVKDDSFRKIHFPDGEVAGMVLVPMKDAQQLLEQRKVPLASALTKSLPKCLERWVQNA
jgi:8-oxo-dGTP pyrophosphatase MutT (NUDIX family)